MLLGIGERLGVEFARFQSLVNIACEGEGGLDAIGRFGIEGLEAGDVQRRQVVRNPHQAAKIGLCLTPCGRRQACGILHESTFSAGDRRIGLGEVEPFGGRENDQQFGGSVAAPLT